MLKGVNISFSYDKKSASENILNDVSFEINVGDFIGIIGTSGSGKTTLIKHFNGLLRASSGELYLNDKNVYDKNFDLFKLRKEVGLVFQYPENQLFKKTVIEDTMFGPINLGMSEEEARTVAERELKFVGIDEVLFTANPMELSGGQKRSVAIAGVLAMSPKIIVLDEPAAGLDFYTKSRIFDLLKRIITIKKMAVVFVSHNMEDVANYANQVWIMKQGTLISKESVQTTFSRDDIIDLAGMDVPEVTKLTKDLISAGIPLKSISTTVDEAEKNLSEVFKKNRGH
ncbi:ATP-binding cassette domain-containing protein [Companilactobacillus kedongensis]|uniref:ATP-binding cassette domain-containing protein n=1 Tax=Companilactobacillus kedongensis TaxID=2486004 RepID=UPI000F7A92E6|nr:ATP-binding cassette domain-containing protein [Companilactobacillus kedongensis]